MRTGNGKPPSRRKPRPRTLGSKGLKKSNVTLKGLPPLFVTVHLILKTAVFGIISPCIAMLIVLHQIPFHWEYVEGEIAAAGILFAPDVLEIMEILLKRIKRRIGRK